MTQDRISWQSAVGLAASSTLLTTALALSISALFSPPIFLSWVALAAMAGVPTQIVIAGVCPKMAGHLPQPLRGLAQIGVTVLVAGLITSGLAFGIGDGSMPSPILVMYVILSISVAFWWIVGFGAWPITAIGLSPTLSGLVSIVAIYAMTYLAYAAFFNFSFLADRRLDPEGLFDAWDSLLLAVTTVALLLAAMLFGVTGRQPWLGLKVFGGALALALLLTTTLPTDRVFYLVHGPVAFIFGFFIVMTLMRGQAFRGLAQPAKGGALTAAAMAVGTAMVQLYGLAAPGDGRELWVATAMLAVTFPLISAFAGSLDFWPLIRRSHSAPPSEDGS